MIAYRILWIFVKLYHYPNSGSHVRQNVGIRPRAHVLANVATFRLPHYPNSYYVASRQLKRYATAPNSVTGRCSQGMGSGRSRLDHCRSVDLIVGSKRVDLALMSKILPDAVAAAEVWGESTDHVLLADESAVLGSVAPRRRRDFTLGRACAFRALAELGVERTPLLPGPSRQPLWPPGIVGSITHCDGYCAAAVAWDGCVTTIGIDAELRAPLPDGVLSRVATPEERAALLELPASEDYWDRLLFSAKESVFKAWHPLAGTWLGFEDAVVTFDPRSATFVARLQVAGPNVAGKMLTEFTGAYTISSSFIATAIVLERSRSTAPTASLPHFNMEEKATAVQDHAGNDFQP